MLIGIDASRANRPQPTGTEAYARHLIRALWQSNPGHRLRLYMSTLPTSELAALLRPDACEARVIPWPRLWTHMRLAWEIWRRPPDLLFIPAHVMPLACRVPTVVTVHDLGYRFFPEAHPRLARWYLEWSTRRHTRLAVRVIADSEATRRDLIRQYGADPERVAVVYPGRDEALTRQDDPAHWTRVRARYGIPGDYLLYLGTLQPRKNLVRLLQAFAGLLAAEPSAAGLSLVLAGGRGWHAAHVEHWIERLDLVGRVVLTGYVAETDKAALLSAALALVYPSLYEGFGLPLLEAMACGTPILTSNISSLPEVAGPAAVLVDPLSVESITEGMARLIRDPALRAHLVQQGYLQLHRFAWDQAAAQLWQVFEAVMSYS